MQPCRTLTDLRSKGITTMVVILNAQRDRKYIITHDGSGYEHGSSY